MVYHREALSCKKARHASVPRNYLTSPNVFKDVLYFVLVSLPTGEPGGGVRTVIFPRRSGVSADSGPDPGGNLFLNLHFDLKRSGDKVAGVLL